MSEWEHGSQDPTEHQKTFEWFLKVMGGMFGIAALILIFLAIVGT
ncbi:MAG: aa3-type cytochrome c oxidase subunit IV [Pikeienuella sp.]